MPARLIAFRQNGGDERWCQKPGLHKRSPGNCQPILGMRPLQEVPAFNRVGVAALLDHGAIGQILDLGLMPSKALGMEFPVKVIDLAAANKAPGICPAAEETGPVARRQGRDLIQEKERGVALPHGFMLHVLVVHVAAYPVLAGPAALAKRPVIAVEFPAAVAHHGAALRHGHDATVGLNAVLQGHGREPEWRREVSAA